MKELLIIFDELETSNLAGKQKQSQQQHHVQKQNNKSDNNKILPRGWDLAAWDNLVELQRQVSSINICWYNLCLEHRQEY